MAHVLLGFAEALPAPEVVFSLLNAGHQVSAFTRQQKLPISGLPLQQLHILPAPEDNAEAAVAALRTIMAAPNAPNAPDFILPLDDGALWLSDMAFGNDPRTAGASGQQVQVALNKITQIDEARISGLPVPETRVVRTADDLDGFSVFPAIAKPAYAIRARDGRLGKGTPVYLQDQSSLAKVKDMLAQATEPFLVQPLIHGVGEGVFGFADKTGVSAWSGHRRVRMMNPHGSGSSACISLRPDPDLCRKVEIFLARIGWRGAFMVEFLRSSDGTPWFMELNGRMWGSLALARRQGLEYPSWNVALAQDPGFVPEVPAPPASPIVQRNLGREMLHLLFVLRGAKSTFHRAEWPGFWTSLAGVLKPTHPRNFYNYDPKHRSFFLREAFWTLSKALRR